LKWKKQGIINNTTQFYVQDGTETAGKFNWEEWYNLDVDDLMLLGRYRNRMGIFTNEPITEKLATLREQLKHEMKTGIVTK
jgi:glycerophosphoryl diester phosphodiesterase